ncbi:AAA family ATPase [Actinoplanes sp. NPDC049265]|uniref:AAA family ATPase n=1 Tax=Actinoplanes sp. NPDC049265 TaxID=3363902 RepID=UPI00371F1D01
MTILITGMSGTGKSTVLAELGRRGHRVVDTDYGGYAVETADGQVWDEERVGALLGTGPDFVSGCVPNQGVFYPRFAAVVLLSAPLDVLLERVGARTTNPFGRTPEQRARIAADHAAVEPLLRAGASIELDARRPVEDLAAEIETISGSPTRHPPRP